MIQTSTVPRGETRPDLGIDLGTFRCGRSSLTRREHQILSLLNKHFGLMVAWERLIDMLYACDENGGPENPKNVLSVVVCALRRKMLPTGYQIVTVHNKGLLLKHRDHVEAESTARRSDRQRRDLSYRPYSVPNEGREGDAGLRPLSKGDPDVDNRNQRSRRSFCIPSQDETGMRRGRLAAR